MTPPRYVVAVLEVALVVLLLGEVAKVRRDVRDHRAAAVTSSLAVYRRLAAAEETIARLVAADARSHEETADVYARLDLLHRWAEVLAHRNGGELPSNNGTWQEPRKR